jgi:hypothetical protein
MGNPRFIPWNRDNEMKRRSVMEVMKFRCRPVPRFALAALTLVAGYWAAQT